MPDFPLFEKEVDILGARKLFVWVIISTCVFVIVISTIHATHRTTVYIGFIAYSQIQPCSVTERWPSFIRAFCCITIRQQPELVIVGQRKYKRLPRTVLIEFFLTLPFLPLIRCKASNYFVELSLAHHQSVPNVKTVLIKLIHLEIVLWSSI